MALHEYAQLFPPMTDAEYHELVEDIRQHGQQHPIITYKGLILDGAHRARACHDLGITPKAVEFKGDDPLALVISMNLARRHLNSGQRAILAQKLRPLYRGSGRVPTTLLAAAALQTGVSYVYAAVRLEKEAPDLHEAVRKGETNISQALKVLAERTAPAGPKPKANRIPPVYRPGTGRYDQRRQKQARLFIEGFSLMEGTLAGAEHLDMQLVAEGLGENLAFWLTKLNHMARDLRAVHHKLKEHANV